MKPGFAMRASIICIGNRFVETDAIGPAVYDRLQRRLPVPEDVEVIDGGLMGLNLLPLLERGGRVVFVDAVSGFGRPEEVVLLDRQQILDDANATEFDHNAGLAYLLAVLPRVCDGKMPEEIILVGLEGTSSQLVEQAAHISLEVAMHGLKDRS
jgi:hydrogenase maturation protease